MTTRSIRLRSSHALPAALAAATALTGCDAVLGIPDPVHAPAGAPLPSGWYELPPVPPGFAGRSDHSAVWTNREMIIWGGLNLDDPAGALNTGAAFDPALGTWRSMRDAPIEGRWGHATAWTGTYLLVWGGTNALANTFFADGAAYDPEDDSWVALPAVPTGFAGRTLAQAAWSTTTNEFVIWSGETKGGSAAPDGMAFHLDPNATPDHGSWRTIASSGVIEGRDRAPTVWMGARMIFIGGEKCLASSVIGACLDGALYDPRVDAWADLSPLPEVFDGPLYGVGIATGEGKATFWGGYQQNAGGSAPVYSSQGATYDDATGTWSALNDPGGAFDVPKRQSASAWYGAGKMFVWGGRDANFSSIDTGGAYDFTTSTWSALPMQGAPTRRYEASAVWTGDSGIVFGGVDDELHAFSDGKIYRP